MPNLALPKGGGAVRSIGEKFDVRSFTGTAGFSVPIATTKGRDGVGPELALTYDSGNGNGPFGLGWSLGLPSIHRKTALGLPRYGPGDSSDVYLLSGVDDLVPALLAPAIGQVGSAWEVDRLKALGFEVTRYRPRTESSFQRIERWSAIEGGVEHWRVIDRANRTSIFGKSPQAKIHDPGDLQRTFEWLLEETHDERGHIIRYDYRAENMDGVSAAMAGESSRLRQGGFSSQRYLSSIKYGNAVPFVSADFALEVVFDYGEHGTLDAPSWQPSQSWDVRPDRFSDFRPGFEVRTYRLCRRVLMFHRFVALGPNPVLVGATHLQHALSPVASQLQSARQSGYLQAADGTWLVRDLPALTFSYQQPEFQLSAKTLAPGSTTQVPGGVDGAAARWMDLDSEGIPGVLTDVGGAWLYKRNLGDGILASAVRVDPLPGRPNLQGTASGAGGQLLDLGGDGHVYYVDYRGPTPGFQMRTDDGWTPLRRFETLPTVNFGDPQGQFIDLNGDGFADFLRTEQQALTWFPSLGRQGFATLRRVWQAQGERDGPKFVFDDGTGTIHLADMSGDGLTDIVRITNGAVSYWPNLGYGRFGPQVRMGFDGPFDVSEAFDSRRVRLADVDGSGTTDVIYLGHGQAHIYVNQSGNSLAEPVRVSSLPVVDTLSTFTVVDLLGTGTGCLVWSSSLPSASDSPVRYVDLLGSLKPYLLTAVDNGRGLRTLIQYKPSTHFYLEDRAAGLPWLTRLPFVVQVVAKVDSVDSVAQTRRTRTFWYRHGYFDGREREFRGFGMVEERDADVMNPALGVGSYTDVPKVQGKGDDAELTLAPMRTRTFFHTGQSAAVVHPGKLFAGDFFASNWLATIDPETTLPDAADAEERFEACRALRGKQLRTEIYAVDGPLAGLPYVVTVQSSGVRMVQPREGNRHAVMLAHDRESISLHSERSLDDPRIEHAITLEVDAWGNTVRTVHIGYGRDEAKATPASQAALLLRGEERWLHNPAQAPTDKLTLDAAQHIGIEIEATVRGLPVAALPALAGQKVYRFSQIATALPSGSGSVLSRSQTVYCEWPVPGGLQQPAPLGQVQTPAMPHHVQHLVGTTTELAEAIGASPAELQALLASGTGLYFEKDAGETFCWAPSPSQRYDSAWFYQTDRVTDPVGNEWQLQHDAEHWLPNLITDPLGEQTKMLNNYRLLQPYAVIDPNGNRQVVRYDALGVPVALSVMGKAGSTDGDLAVIDEPEATPADEYTATFEYTVGKADQGKPDFVRARRRQRHGDPDSPWEESLAYFDGSGRLALTMTRCLPDDVQPSDVSRRWVGSGKVVFDNKGNPVKQYEPFFASDDDWTSDEALIATGVTAILRYDPLGRLVRTDFPDGSYTRIDRSPWHQGLWDQNDTIADSQWFAQRLLLPPTNPERIAAQQAYRHRNTPWIEQFDALGRIVLQESDNTFDDKSERDLFRTHIAWDLADRPVQVVDARGVTSQRWRYDLLGQLVRGESPDSGGRSFSYAADGADLARWTPTGVRVRTSYDAMRRPTGRLELQASGSERQIERIVYGESFDPADALAANLLGVPVLVYHSGGLDRTVERSFQGQTTQVQRRLVHDPSTTPDWSTLTVPLLLDGSDDATGTAAGVFDAVAFDTTMDYDALGRVTRTTTADGSTIHRLYNLRGQLDRVTSGPDPTKPTILLDKVRYTPRGQRIEVRRGNGTRTTHSYDPWTFRLATTWSGKLEGSGVLQDLHYTYDPVGNVFMVLDSSQPVVFYGNAEVSPVCSYQYDPAYRLVVATGREQVVPANNGAPSWLGLPGTPIPLPTASALRTFMQTYSYDAVGNLTSMQHNAGAGNKSAAWTRTYAYESGTSRLASTTVGNVPSTYAHDVAGNMSSMPHLPDGLHWDVDDRLRRSVNGAGLPTAYGYDGNGNRVVKATATQAGNPFQPSRRTVYLPGRLDLQQSFTAGGTTTSATWTLSVGDDDGVLVRIERTEVPGKVATPLRRYALADLLRSVTVEVDDAGNLLGFEQYTPYGGSCVRIMVKGAAGYSTSRYRFNGKERDFQETGLYYYGARYYAPWLGRWTAADPVPEPRRSPFAFCSGNPVSRADFDGRSDVTIIYGEVTSITGSGVQAAPRGPSNSGAVGLAEPVGKVAAADVDIDLFRQLRIQDLARAGELPLARPVMAAGGVVAYTPAAVRAAEAKDRVRQYDARLNAIGGPGSTAAGLAAGGSAAVGADTKTTWTAMKTAAAVGQLLQASFPLVALAAGKLGQRAEPVVGPGTGGTAPGSGSPRVNEALKLLRESGGKVVVNPKNPALGQEGNITIHFDSGNRINLRVETHPLRTGGPPTRHANVETVITVGSTKKITNTHVTE